MNDVDRHSTAIDDLAIGRHMEFRQPHKAESLDGLSI